MVNDKFTNWLIKRMDERDWTQADLAKASRVSKGAISHIFSGKRQPGADICRSIAQALRLPPEMIYREAGLLPPSPEKDQLNDLILFLSNQLPEEEKEDLVEYIRLRIERANGRGKRGESKQVARIIE